VIGDFRPSATTNVAGPQWYRSCAIRGWLLRFQERHHEPDIDAFTYRYSTDRKSLEVDQTPVVSPQQYDHHITHRHHAGAPRLPVVRLA
jgi:hypothetical protein